MTADTLPFTGLFNLSLLATWISLAIAAKSSMTYVPQGSNPLLYQPGVEPIMHLDQVFILALLHK